ncbi:MAG TPA: Holliday junction branch migration protein RuvA [Stellaceae bacterium]|jgi:Holliday junction DNA helicase RuvA|nr:Holliday junction branch migration protein RuvA [Stellaceae bacterium]
MIAKLSGVLDSAGSDGVVVDVGGVGYLVFCSARTLRQLPGKGEAVRLVIETHVREDHIHLYGFIDEAERSAYRLLTTVQGVGAKVALAILGAVSPDDLVAAIAAQDRAALTRADGVGPKLATRIVVELRDKVGGLSLAATLIEGATPILDGVAADAVSALVNLGYRRVDAFGAISRASRKIGSDAKLDALIRGGLKELAP